MYDKIQTIKITLTKLKVERQKNLDHLKVVERMIAIKQKELDDLEAKQTRQP